MKNDKLVEFIEVSLENCNVIKDALYKNCLLVDFKEGTLYFFDNGHIEVKDILLNVDDLESIHKICVAIKNNIFK